MINNMDNGPLYSRLHKTSCCEDQTPACNCLWRPCRVAVSGSKRRYKKDDYDLDLTYLGSSKPPRLIVHGFPAVGLEHLYRNPRYEVRRFLEERHAGHYKMFNFCCEPGRGYPATVFDDRVERYPFKDHNTPPLETLIEFGESAKAWLDADPLNVCSMHCKAGKGRAGLMSCVLMIRSGEFQSAVEALDHYDATRVMNNKGLTVTSQRKYVLFYEMLWRQYYGETGDIGKVPGSAPLKRKVPTQPELFLSEIKVLKSKIPLRNVRVVVYKGGNMKPKQLYDTGKGSGKETSFTTPCVIQGNFKILVKHKPSVLESETKLFELWHNTLFDMSAETVDFKIDLLDIKKKVAKELGDSLTLRLKFSVERPPGESLEEDEDESKGSGEKGGEYEMVPTRAAGEDGEEVGAAVEGADA